MNPIPSLLGAALTLGTTPAAAHTFAMPLEVTLSLEAAQPAIPEVDQDREEHRRCSRKSEAAPTPSTDYAPIPIQSEGSALTLQSCGRMRFEVAPNQPVWMYAVYRESADWRTLVGLWPMPGLPVPMALPEQKTWFPAPREDGPLFFYLLEEPMQEELALIFSPFPLEGADIERLADPDTDWESIERPAPTMPEPQPPAKSTPAPATPPATSKPSTAVASSPPPTAPKPAAALPPSAFTSLGQHSAARQLGDSFKAIAVGQQKESGASRAKLVAEQPGQPVVFVLDIEHTPGLEHCPEGWRFEP